MLVITWKHPVITAVRLAANATLLEQVRRPKNLRLPLRRVIRLAQQRIAEIIPVTIISQTYKVRNLRHQKLKVMRILKVVHCHNLARQAAANRNLARQAAANRNLARQAAVNRNLARQAAANRNLARQAAANHNLARQAAANRNLARQAAANRNLARQAAVIRNLAR